MDMMDMDIEHETSSLKFEDEIYFDHSGHIELLRIWLFYEKQFREIRYQGLSVDTVLEKYENMAKQLKEALINYGKLGYFQCLIHRFYLSHYGEENFSAPLKDAGREYINIFASLFDYEAGIFPSKKYFPYFSGVPQKVYKVLTKPLKVKEKEQIEKFILGEMTNRSVITTEHRKEKRERYLNPYYDGDESEAVRPKYKRAEKLVSRLLRYV